MKIEVMLGEVRSEFQIKGNYPCVGYSKGVRGKCVLCKVCKGRVRKKRIGLNGRLRLSGMNAKDVR